MINVLPSHIKSSIAMIFQHSLLKILDILNEMGIQTSVWSKLESVHLPNESVAPGKNCKN